jgi:tape measure domain-containing protein
MATGVGTLIVRLKAITNQFRKEMDAATERTRKLERAAVDASGTIARSLAVVGAAAAVAGGAAVKLAAQWEQTEIAFTTMLGSSEKAKTFLRDLDKFAARTPFELPGLIDASRKLLAFGFEAESIIPVMTSVGDAVAALGGGRETIDRVTRALGQMSAKGVIASQEMTLQLAEAGIPAWRYLAEAIGVDIPTAMKMVERRMVPASIGIQAILQGMTKDFGGSMEKQSKTMIGVWSTAKDETRTLARGFGAYLIDTFNLDEVVARLGRSIGRMADVVRSAEKSADGFRKLLRQTFGPKTTAAVLSVSGALLGALVPALKSSAIMAWRATMALAPFMIKGAVLAVVAYNLYDALTNSSSAMDKVAAASLAAGAALYFAYSSGMVAFVAGIKASVIAMYAKIATVTTLKGKLVALLALLGPKGWAVLAGAVAVTTATIGIFNRVTAQTIQVAGGAARGMDDLHRAASAAASGQQQLEKALDEAGKAAARNIMGFDQVHTLQEAMGRPDLAMPDVAVGGILGAAQAMGEMISAVKEYSVEHNNLAKVFEKDRAIVGRFFDTMISGPRDAWNSIARMGLQISRNVSDTWAAIVGVWERGRDRLAGIGGMLSKRASENWGELSADWNAFWAGLGAAIDKLAPGLRAAWDTFWTNAGTWWATWRTNRSADWGNFWMGLKTTVRNFGPNLLTAWQTAWGAIRDWWSTWRTNRQTDWRTFWTNARVVIENLGPNLFTAWQASWGKLCIWWSTWIGNRLRNFNTFWADLEAAVKNLGPNLRREWDSFWGNLGDSVVRKIQPAIDVVNRLIDAYNRIPALPDIQRIQTGAGTQPAAQPAMQPATQQRSPDQVVAIAATAANRQLYQAQLAWGAANRAGDAAGMAAAAAAGQAARAAGATEAGAQQIWQGIAMAKGGIVTGPTYALVGEAGTEAVLPLRRGNPGVEAIAEAVGNAVFTAMREAIRVSRVEQGRDDGGQEIVLEIDSAKIGRAILPALTRERLRLGIVEV